MEIGNDTESGLNPLPNSELIQSCVYCSQSRSSSSAQSLHFLPSRPLTTSEKWQYAVIAPNDANLEKVLNNDGADGWKLSPLVARQVEKVQIRPFLTNCQC